MKLTREGLYAMASMKAKLTAALALLHDASGLSADADLEGMIADARSATRRAVNAAFARLEGEM